MNPLVYIIILNWNGYKDTIKCLQSLKKIKYNNFKILVVDNSSVDNSIKEIKKNFHSIEIISNPKNLGYAGGNNVGIKVALSKNPQYILLLNNDTFVEDKFLSELIKFAETDDKIGIVGPKIFYSYNKSIIWFAGGEIDYRNGPFISIGQFQMDSPEFCVSKNVDYINGCSMLIKKEVLLKIGLLDEDYFAYVEDVDFNVRAKKAGFKSYFVPSAKIYHNISASTGGEGNIKKEYYKSRNLVLFAKKNLNRKKQLQFYFQILPIKTLEVYNHLKKGELKHIAYAVQGTLDGFRNKLSLQ